MDPSKLLNAYNTRRQKLPSESSIHQLHQLTAHNNCEHIAALGIFVADLYHEFMSNSSAINNLSAQVQKANEDNARLVQDLAVANATIEKFSLELEKLKSSSSSSPPSSLEAAVKAAKDKEKEKNFLNQSEIAESSFLNSSSLSFLSSSVLLPQTLSSIRKPGAKKDETPAQYVQYFAETYRSAHNDVISLNPKRMIELFKELTSDRCDYAIALCDADYEGEETFDVVAQAYISQTTFKHSSLKLLDKAGRIQLNGNQLRAYIKAFSTLYKLQDLDDKISETMWIQLFINNAASIKNRLPTGHTRFLSFLKAVIDLDNEHRIFPFQFNFSSSSSSSSSSPPPSNRMQRDFGKDTKSTVSWIVDLPPHSSSGLTASIDLDEQRVSATIDTGSSFSWMSSDLADKCNVEQRSAKSLTFSSATSHAICSDKTIEVPVSFGKDERHHVVFRVSSDLKPGSCIVGLDFLKKNNASIVFSSKPHLIFPSSSKDSIKESSSTNSAAAKVHQSFHKKDFSSSSSVDVNVPSFNVGDIVICQIDLRHKPIPSLWEERFRGPFKIINKITDSIVRVRGQFTYARAFNINLKHLKPFTRSSNSVETILTNMQLKELQKQIGDLSRFSPFSISSSPPLSSSSSSSSKDDVRGEDIDQILIVRKLTKTTECFVKTKTGKYIWINNKDLESVSNLMTHFNTQSPRRLF